MGLPKTHLTAATAAGALLLFAGVAAAAEKVQLELTVQAGEHDRRDAPVRVDVQVPRELADVQAAELTGPDGSKIAAQLTAPGLLNDAQTDGDGAAAREIHFVLPKLAAGQEARFTAKIGGDSPASPSFTWHNSPGEYADLFFDGQPVLRYMYRALDESSPMTREQSYKVFHHLYSPDGSRLVTKGPGGLYTHHRGLFYGFNRVTYGDGKRADIWHCTGDTHQAHDKFLSSEAGPVLGRHRVAIDWHGVGKEIFAEEQRELAVYRLPGAHVVEFASRLRSTGEPIRLDGDPQHAGFHFRAANEVAERTKDETYYVRIDGTGRKAETRNWSPDNRDTPVGRESTNRPWNAMNFVLGDTRYTATYLDRPENPKEARSSERDYGRFGTYFEYDLPPDGQLDVRYRLWLTEGETTAEEAAFRYVDFVDPPAVQVRVVE